MLAFGWRMPGLKSAKILLAIYVLELFPWHFHQSIIGFVTWPPFNKMMAQKGG